MHVDTERFLKELEKCPLGAIIFQPITDSVHLQVCANAPDDEITEMFTVSELSKFTPDNYDKFLAGIAEIMRRPGMEEKIASFPQES